MSNIKIMLYPKSSNINTILYTNGTVLDKVCTSLKSTEDILGGYTLDASFIASEITDYILQEESVFRVLCDYGYEVFYVTKVVKHGKYLDVVARQITIDMSLGLWLEDVRPTDLGGQGALNYLLANAEGNNDYTFTWNISLSSNILAINTAYYLNKNLDQALRSEGNSFINKWGGYIKRRKFNITINSTIGSDRGLKLIYGKNIVSYEYESYIDETYSKVRGSGYNGIKGNWIVSSKSYKALRRNEYSYNVRVADGSSDSNYVYFDTEALAIAELDRLAALEFTVNKVDEKKKNYRVNYVDIYKSEEYKGKYSSIPLYTGDTIQLLIDKENINETLKVTQRVYNHLKQEVTDMVLSNYDYVPTGWIKLT